MHTCISTHRLKRSSYSCPRQVNARNKNTPSMHHPWRRNVTTSMVGLKKSHTQKPHPKWWTPEIYLMNAEEEVLIHKSPPIHTHTQTHTHISNNKNHSSCKHWFISNLIQYTSPSDHNSFIIRFGTYCLQKACHWDRGSNRCAPEQPCTTIIGEPIDRHVWAGHLITIIITFHLANKKKKKIMINLSYEALFDTNGILIKLHY